MDRQLAIGYRLAPQIGKRTIDHAKAQPPLRSIPSGSAGAKSAVGVALAIAGLGVPWRPQCATFARSRSWRKIPWQFCEVLFRVFPVFRGP